MHAQLGVRFFVRTHGGWIGLDYSVAARETTRMSSSMPTVGRMGRRESSSAASKSAIRNPWIVVKLPSFRCLDIRGPRPRADDSMVFE